MHNNLRSNPVEARPPKIAPAWHDHCSGGDIEEGGGLRQHTLKREVACAGVGLHSGRVVAMRLKPAPAGFGVHFCRVDLPGSPLVAARYDRVVQTERATTLASNGVRVSTTEHLLAALLCGGVDNALVELDGPEVPIFDGSAVAYLSLLQKAGLAEQGSPRRYLRVTQTMMVQDGDSFVKVRPADRLQICYTIDFSHPLVGKQTSRWSYDPTSFARDIAGARTFGFLRDLNRLRNSGMALGGSLANAMVFDDKNLLNRDGFRLPDECARHKVLDLIGDIALAGVPILAQFEAYKAGHALHNQLLRELLANPECYEMITPLASKPQLVRVTGAGPLIQPLPLAVSIS
jgi:UDP-3-O-[3-hydroxymyristoyl] N-acetylglucosamine deacetylase